MAFSRLKSLTFLVGLVLFGGGFVIALVTNNLLNPPPFSIVVARDDIEPYTILTEASLAVYDMRMSAGVARRLVHEYELERYVGHIVIEPIHQGEPLRRNALVSPDNPLAPSRLALAIDDPNTVAMVVPVDPRTIPQQIAARDYVDLVLGIAHPLLASYAPQAQAPLSDETEMTTGTIEALPPVIPPGVPEGVISGTGSTAPAAATTLEPNLLLDVTPPLAKVAVRGVQVISVQRKQVANPNYGSSLGGGNQTTQPAYISGPIESVTLLIPRDAEELVAFALDNGTVRISLLSHAAVFAGTLNDATTAILWEDFERYIQEERLRALGVLTGTVPVALAEAAPPGEGSNVLPAPAEQTPIPDEATPSIAETPAMAALEQTPTPQDAHVETTPPAEQTPMPVMTGSTMVIPEGVSSLALPFCAGIGLVAGVAVVLVLVRKRK